MNIGTSLDLFTEEVEVFDDSDVTSGEKFVEVNTVKFIH